MTRFLRMRAQPLKDAQRRRQQHATPDWLQRQGQAKAAKAQPKASGYERVHYVGSDGRALPTYYRRRKPLAQALEAKDKSVD
jgi:hypothetical protein